VAGPESGNRDIEDIQDCSLGAGILTAGILNVPFSGLSDLLPDSWKPAQVEITAGT
jgi:hypothetical protein